MLKDWRFILVISIIIGIIMGVLLVTIFRLTPIIIVLTMAIGCGIGMIILQLESEK